MCTRVHVFPRHHLLMQSAIMWSAPLISLLCMVTVQWKSRDFCTAAVCSIKKCMVKSPSMHVQTAHSSFNKCPPLPCMQSKPLTHSLASGIYIWLLAFTSGFSFTTLTCLVSCNYSLSGFSVALIFLYWNPYCTPVWFLGIMAVLCTPVAVLCGFTWHVSL